MLVILKKEINLYLSSLIAYIVISVFLLTTGLFVWIFPETNVLDGGYANIDTLFIIAPWVFIFLAPAITMRFFSEEIKSGTIEIIAVKPVRDFEIILGKYFAGVILIVFSLVPTLLYYYAVYDLGVNPGNIDSGAIGGSYIGLLLIGAAFIAIGLFASATTSNQIVSFIIAVFLCFFCFTGFDSISSLKMFGKIDNVIMQLGFIAHYNSLSRGVVDSRDVVYFFSVIALFILFTKIAINKRKW